MKFSCISAILLATSVIQIFAKESDLDKAVEGVIISALDASKIKINEIYTMNTIVPLQFDEIENYVKATLSTLKKLQQMIESEYLDSLPYELKQIQMKIIFYPFFYTSELFRASQKMSNTITNKSFDALPENVKKDLLNATREVEEFLNKYKEAHAKSEANVEKTRQE